jgi:hypothetical protein
VQAPLGQVPTLTQWFLVAPEAFRRIASPKRFIVADIMNKKGRRFGDCTAVAPNQRETYCEEAL